MKWFVWKFAACTVSTVEKWTVEFVVLRDVTLVDTMQQIRKMISTALVCIHLCHLHSFISAHINTCKHEQGVY